MSANKKKAVINCNECVSQSDCCLTGAWLDLEEAKKIASLGLKGEFFQLEEDKDFPSGYRIGTSYGYNQCTFLDKDGLCSIHKIDYNLKPKSCREFPYEGENVSSVVGDLCTLYRKRTKKKRRQGVCK